MSFLIGVREMTKKLLLTFGTLLFLSSLLSLSSCGGGGGGIIIDSMTIDMSPLRVVGFSDDGPSDPLHPVVFLGDIPNGETLLMRVRDPFGLGDFYSIKIRNGYGEVSSGTPTADEGEPDNNLIDAATLTLGAFLHRGLNPLFDEDWFTFTSSGECCNYVATRSNSSGSAADPILEVYDPTPNLGPITYTLESDGFGAETLIAGVYDPTNNLTLIAMTQLWDVNIGDSVDRNSFALVFAGPLAPGDYPIRFAFPLYQMMLLAL